MKLGIISDTHDRLDSLPPAITLFKEHDVDAIIHCGDWIAPFTIEFFHQTLGDWTPTVYSVFGNDEGDIKRIIERNALLKNPVKFALKIVMELEFNHRHLAIFHGHDQVILRSLIQSGEYDAVFTGHTHVPRNEVMGNTLVFNPGSTSYTQNSQIIDQATIGIYDTTTNTAELLTLPR
jgi:uncharacterized protein